MNIFGINGTELVVLIVLALVLLGPEKIPQYTRALRDGVRKLRQLGETAKVQFKEETGTDFDDVDWSKYDPRQYDPRRIISEALSEPLKDVQDSVKDVKDMTAPSGSAAASSASASSAKASPTQPKRPAAGIRATAPETSATAAATTAAGATAAHASEDKTAGVENDNTDTSAETTPDVTAPEEPQEPWRAPFDDEAT